MSKSKSKSKSKKKNDVKNMEGRKQGAFATIAISGAALIMGIVTAFMGIKTGRTASTVIGVILVVVMILNIVPAMKALAEIRDNETRYPKL